MITEPWRKGEIMSARKLNEERDVARAIQQATGDEFIRVSHIGESIVVGLDLNTLLPKIPKKRSSMVFAGGCIVKADAPDTAFANTLVIQNTAAGWGGGNGYADATVEQRLLLKFANPVTNNSGMVYQLDVANVVTWDFNVGEGGAAAINGYFRWELHFITENFEFEGDDCATFNTKPAVFSDVDPLIYVPYELYAAATDLAASTTPRLTYRDTPYPLLARKKRAAICSVGTDQTPTATQLFGLEIRLGTASPYWAFLSTQGTPTGADSELTVDLSDSRVNF